MSRLAEHHHHLEDIIAGGTIGVVVGWFVVAGLSRKFSALERYCGGEDFGTTKAV